MNKGHTTGGEPISDHQLQLNTRLVPALVGLLLILQLAFPYQGWTILLVGLGGAWLTSYLWARSLARGLRLVREMRFGWAQVGDRLEERFTLFNDGWAPALWVELEDHSTMPDYRASTVRYVSGQASNRWHSDAVCARRGLYTLGPTGLRTGDPLGLYTVRLQQPESTTLMVTPPILPLPAIEVAPGGRAGEGRRPRAESLERTVSASSVRDYVPGDSLRWIHWRVSAHRDDLFVRILDNTPASDWWIFLDLDRRVQVGQGWDSTEEHGVTLAASLAGRGLQAGRAVGVVAHGQDLVWLPPRAGDEQRLAILRALALVAPGPLPLAELLERAQPAPGQRPSLVVITPAVRGDWIEALLPLLRRGVVPTVLLLDPASFGGRDLSASPVKSPLLGSRPTPVGRSGTETTQQGLGSYPEGTPGDFSRKLGDDSGPAPRESIVAQPGESEFTGIAEGTLALLSDLGVAHYAITRDLLDRPEARPGQRGQWQWRVFATGHAVPLSRPRDTAWRALS